MYNVLFRARSVADDMGVRFPVDEDSIIDDATGFVGQQRVLSLVGFQRADAPNADPLQELDAGVPRPMNSQLDEQRSDDVVVIAERKSVACCICDTSKMEAASRVCSVSAMTPAPAYWTGNSHPANPTSLPPAPMCTS